MGGSGESCGALGLSLILGRGPGGALGGGPRGLFVCPGGVLGLLGGVLGASRWRRGASWGVLGAFGESD